MEHTNLSPFKTQLGPARHGSPSLSLESIYRARFRHVARWARAMGANEADVEDLTQEVFIIVGRKLEQFDGRSLLGFLYRITARTARDYRRSAWIRNIVGKRSPFPELQAPGIDGLHIVQQKERKKVVESLLAKMSEKRRTTFILFEIEGYSGEEIAEMQSLPIDTVWTRLHNARKEFMRHVAELSSMGEAGVTGQGEYGARAARGWNRRPPAVTIVSGPPAFGDAEVGG
jgi:RNA polymerase sigma-70 factor, ECF subfamily